MKIDFTKSQNIILTLTDGRKVLYTGPVQIFDEENVTNIMVSQPIEGADGIEWNTERFAELNNGK